MGLYNRLNMKIPLNTLLGSLCGGIAGFGWGLVVAELVGIMGRFAHPEDPSSGSGAIIGIATAPFGFIVGLIGGYKCPRASYFAILPIAVLIIVLALIN